MKRLIITESDRENILNQHKKAIQNENIGGRSDTRTDKMRQKYPDGIEMPKEITSSGGNTFLNGIDKINENNPKIIEIIDTLKKALESSTGDVKITVNGGASNTSWGNNAAGSPEAIRNNKELAKRRRDNLINFINKKIQDSRLKITPGETKVGDATVKNSPEANKEQFVSAKITGTGKMNVPLKLDYQDNTSVYKPEIFRNKEKNRIPVTFDPEIRICLRIPKSKKQSFIKMLSVWARENGIAGEVPWRETKIK
jgi:hypothetical protein